jgi:hypothetical protein
LVVVLWECGVHMVTLSDEGDGGWQARSGTQDVADLLEQLDQEAAFEAEIYEPELVDSAQMWDLLNPENLDRRRLVSEGSFAHLGDSDS